MPGFFPNIFGAYDTRDLQNLRVADVPGGEAAIVADINQWRDFFEERLTAYENLLAVRVTTAQGAFGTGGGGGEMQEYTEFAEVEATRTAEAQWQYGLPIRRVRDRQLYTEEYVKLVTLEQLNRDVIYATMRNYQTRMKMLLRALLLKTNYTFNDGTEGGTSFVFPGTGLGNLSVVRLFNNDSSSGQMYVRGDYVTVGTRQHYKPSGAAALAVAQFTLARTTLREIDYTGHVVHLISTSDADAVRGFAGFVPRTEENPYVQVDNNDQPETRAIVTLPETIGVINNGGLGDGEVVAFPFWPAGYTLSLDTTKEKPLAIRERPEPEFRGWRLIQNETSAAYGELSLRNKRFEWIGGSGVRNRANGVAIQATTNGAYGDPTI